MVPKVYRKSDETKVEYIKRYTNILYDSLPQTSLEDREQHHDIRDKIIELNYSFFGYVVSQKFLNNSYASYEDKLQACILRFCTCWTWWKFEKKYRSDVSFTVFYKPRLGEMLEREFNEVQYSLRRSLCVEVANQLDKPWTKLTYEDLSDPRVHISADHMESLKAIFGSLYSEPIDDVIMYFKAPDDVHDQPSLIESLGDEYNDIVNLLIREMIDKERKLTTKDINKMATMYGLDPVSLKSKQQIAENQLYTMLNKAVEEEQNNNISNDSFNSISNLHEYLPDSLSSER